VSQSAPSVPQVPVFGADSARVLDHLAAQTRDAVEGAGFSDVLIGLSGGLDSALVAHIAVQALGAERVHGLLMPAAVSSPGSVTDAHELAGRLGIETMTIPIEPVFAAFKSALSPIFAGRPEDTTEENLQARIRGTLLMALSNKFGWFVLNTGNLSESLMGYTTLYGDMVGSFAPIGGLLKTQVRELARATQIPEAILTKEPSAELAPAQLDRDALGPYEEIDPILYEHFVCDVPAFELLKQGVDGGLLNRVLGQAASARFKWRFAPPQADLSGKDLE